MALGSGPLSGSGEDVGPSWGGGGWEEEGCNGPKGEKHGPDPMFTGGLGSDRCTLRSRVSAHLAASSLSHSMGEALAKVGPAPGMGAALGAEAAADLKPSSGRG